MFINSDKIVVYPSTRRGTHQVSARLSSEYSLVSIINKLIDTNGFVITPEVEGQPTIDFDKAFEFNIHGYYFSVETAHLIVDQFTKASDATIYANIFLDKVPDERTNYEYIELSGQDVPVLETSFEYQGVTFSSEDLTKRAENPADFSLLLFISDGELWYVPYDSRVKFLYDNAIGIDGGEI